MFDSLETFITLAQFQAKEPEHISTHLMAFQSHSAQPTCSHGAFPGKSQKAFFFQNETASNENAGAHSQSQTNIKVIFSTSLAHFVCYLRSPRESH